MINYLGAIIFGLVQGATEFLPISSSGHLILLHKIFPNVVMNELAFDTILHLATLFALIWFFKQDIYLLFKSWIKSLRGKSDNNSKIAWSIIIGILPALIVGYFFSNKIEEIFRSAVWVAIMLISVGLLFILFEKKYGRNIGNLSQMNFKKSFFIGIAQVLAFIPGTSRSGITIIAGLAAGLKREEAARFSFLLSAPLIAAAGLSQVNSLINNSFGSKELTIYILAFFSAVFSGYLSIKYFLFFTQKYSLNAFAYYRIALAILIILLFLV